MAYSEKIIDEAKNLFLTVDDKGNRKYSFQEIAQKLTENKSIKKIVKSTIIGWAKNCNWEIEYQAIKNLGQEKAIQETSDKEKTLFDSKSNDIAERRISAKQIKDKADKILIKILDANIQIDDVEKLSIDARTLQQISNQREDTIQNLDGQQRPEDQINKKIEKLLNLYG